MRTILVILAVLYSAAALAQTQAAPPAGQKPLAQVKPKTAKGPSTKGDSTATKLQACLEIDDGTKERLNCYDAVIPPAAKSKAVKAKAVSDCRFTKEEDERLACFNGFVENMPKLPPKT
jgi:hypothetical protein